jgi:hypothetical protein
LFLERNSFCSFRLWAKDFHDLLRENPSSLFMLLECSTIFITCLMILHISRMLSKHIKTVGILPRKISSFSGQLRMT